MAQGILAGKLGAGQIVAVGRLPHIGDQKLNRLIARTEPLQVTKDRSGLTMGRFALRHCFSRGELSALIPGARLVEQLAQNVAAANGRGLEGDLLAKTARRTADQEIVNEESGPSV